MITRHDYKVRNIVPTINKDKSNLNDFFCADARGGKSFLQNDGGYPMNDIDIILRQQNVRVQQSMIKSLEEIPTTGLPSDTPNQDCLMALRSRYQQTPSEMVRFYERQLEIADAKAIQAQKEAETMKLQPSDNTDVVDNV